MVGVKGLEPSTLCSQSRCASQLRHTPKKDAHHIGKTKLAVIDEKSKHSTNILIFGSAMIIEAANIHKSFGALEVLKGVSLTVDKGEVIAITGASGAGKTTLLQILGTLSTPDSGSLAIDGAMVFDSENRSRCLRSAELPSFRGRKIGFVFQAHHLLPEFTALENVMIPALIAGRSNSDARSSALELLKNVGLEGRINHKPSELSGGEQQRVAIARALVNSPAVLYADEPTGNLDSTTKQEIHRLFFELRERLGQTIVIVTHDPQLAELCDRALVMRDGLFV